MRAYQRTNDNWTSYGENDVPKDRLESCHSEIPQGEDCLVSPGLEAMSSCQVQEEGRQTPTEVPSTSGQAHDCFSEESMDDGFHFSHTPRSISQSRSPSHSRALSDSTKNFRCEHCPKTFTRLYNLKSHLVVHARTMAFSCDICSRSFARKSDAKRHMRTHSGEKDWVCGGCRMSFSRKDMLNSHLKTRKGQACLEYQERKRAEGSERSVSEGIRSPKILSISSLLS